MMKRMILLCLIISKSLFALSQQPFNDAMSWLSLGVEQKVDDRFAVKLLSRFRIGENFTQLNSWYSDLGIQYDVTDHFDVSANYVLAPSRLSNQQFKNFHQYYTSLNYKIKPLRKWELANRMIIQRTSSGGLLDSGDPSKNSTDLRNKLGLTRKINKHLFAFAADEILLPLSSIPFEIKRNRFYTGITHTLAKRTSMDLYFVLQSSYHSSTQNVRYFIYGCDLNFKLKKIKT